MCGIAFLPFLRNDFLSSRVTPSAYRVAQPSTCVTLPSYRVTQASLRVTPPYLTVSYNHLHVSHHHPNMLHKYHHVSHHHLILLHNNLTIIYGWFLRLVTTNIAYADVHAITAALYYVIFYVLSVRRSPECSVDDDDVYEYIAIRQQTASLGEHGAGVYLRLGCLGKSGRARCWCVPAARMSW